VPLQHALHPSLAQSFPFSRARFNLSYPALLAADDTMLLLAVGEDDHMVPAGF
jgi:hypothetical protein